MTCNDGGGVSKSQTAPGHSQSFSSGRRTGNSASVWTAGNWTSSGKTVFHCPRLTTLWTDCGAKWFSILDLKSGYWQVDMHPDDKYKTAFSTDQGPWQFTVMPFGLYNAPVTFERIMKMVLRGLTYKSCLVYLDDLSRDNIVICMSYYRWGLDW
jgi:hypothetical protein